ncbi:hypothetical protein QBC43DRAFT_283386 [Cladorrhinum sp. PSN259]|nr:hypothetical protein QBC43DRAFT_283386 [Cladorrhinum sp. PSN259]
MRSKAPALDDLAKFQDSTEGNVLYVARRVYEVGESLLAGLALDLEKPPKINGETVATIRSDMDAASTGINLMGQLRDQMGEYWPDKGLTTAKDYEMVKDMLAQARDQMAEWLFDDDEAKMEEFKKAWPFDE